MKYKMVQQGDSTTVSLKGDICEGIEADLASVPEQLKTRRVVFDCNDIARINSFGVAEWMAFLNGFGKQHTFSFSRCPVSFIGYANLVLSFMAGGAVESFYVPAYCDTCDQKLDALFTTKALGADRNPAMPACTGCSKPMSPEVDLGDYLTFLDKA